MRRTLPGLVLLAGIAAPAIAAEPAAAKPFTWQTASPASQGMSRDKLDALRDDLARRGTTAFLVVRRDRIVAEWYAPGHDPDRPHYTASLVKAVVGGLSLAVALTDGRIGRDDPAAKYVPRWRDDPKKSRITVRHLGSHTSGLEDAEQDGLPHAQLTGWQGDFWKMLDPPRDPFSLARDAAPVAFDPGRRLQYSNPGLAMLTYCVTASLQGGRHKDVRSLLGDRVLRPIGVGDGEWSCGYGKTVRVDGLPLVASWGGGSFTARGLARVGRLLLREGDWDGTRLLSRAAVRQVTGDAGLPGGCGMGFWTNAAGRYPGLPRDASWGAGAGHQVLLLVPSLGLIAVRQGETLAQPPPGARDDFERFHDPLARILFEPLVAAVADAPAGRGSAPYPPSPAIAGIRWAEPATIVRRARDSDNWPLTWADDGHLYTAYGDGRGFEPFVPGKLSLGFARVEGGPADFRGVNIRSATGERTGDGPAGEKASGMLMVDGVLYLWARNASIARLGWSRDHARTWQWADWKFTTSFGCPTFLNFGKDYAGARDDFVYVYSPDGASAYKAADRMVLARVPRDRIPRRDAYQFFRGADAAGRPLWTDRIEDRGAVFTHPGRCYRGGITYNAGLKRYLWCQVLPPARGTKDDPRLAGGFGIYDAPEPWGPWTTVFFTGHWDVGPGETASLPTKWMSPDGRTVWLVFSGEDAFSIRRAVLGRPQEQDLGP